MRSKLLWILPTLLLLGLVLESLGILHVSYLHIKTHELKWTELDYGYHPKEGDIFTLRETVSNYNYEDALLAFSPSYQQLLTDDLKKITKERSYLHYIDPSERTLLTDNYKIQLCLEKEKLEIKDSTLFRKVVNLELVGYFEVYNRTSGDLVYKDDDEKWWIRDKMTLYGISRPSFIKNKIDEIWLSQVSNESSSLIEEMERPYRYQKELNAMVSLRYLYSTEQDLSLSSATSSASLYLSRLRATMNYGSAYYGRKDEVGYLDKVNQAIIPEEE